MDKEYWENKRGAKYGITAERYAALVKGRRRRKTDRLCRCGCGRVVIAERAGVFRLYALDACRQRHYRLAATLEGRFNKANPVKPERVDECQNCGAEIEQTSRRPKLFCGDTCRKAFARAAT